MNTDWKKKKSSGPPMELWLKKKKYQEDNILH